MAATAWTIYQTFRDHVMGATPGPQINLDGGIFRMALHTTASNASSGAASVTTQGSISNEVANGNGYLTGGKTMASVTWASSAANTYRFDCADVVWTASGGTIPNIEYAVVYNSGASAAVDYLVCRSRLTTTQFTVANGNTLTITINASGIFELT